VCGTGRPSSTKITRQYGSCAGSGAVDQSGVVQYGVKADSRSVLAQQVRLEGRITMLATGTVDRRIRVSLRGAAPQEAQGAVFCNVWLVMRLHVDLLRLASAMCRA
jgi:hypothetical protein